MLVIKLIEFDLQRFDKMQLTDLATGTRNVKTWQKFYETFFGHDYGL